MTPALQELGWPNVDELLARHDLANMRHIIDSQNAPELLRQKFMLRSDVSSRNTRAVTDGQLQLPRVRTEFARRNFYFRAVHAWNSRASP